MERKFYRNYVWYNLTDDEYWAENFPNEFPNCQTIVCCVKPEVISGIFTKESAPCKWEDMINHGEWKFMIIEKP